MKSLYEILGVPKTATVEEIKKAHRKLAKQHHPDRNGGKDEKFKEIQLAWDVLSDPVRRSLYDQTGVISASADNSNGQIIEVLLETINSLMNDPQYYQLFGVNPKWAAKDMVKLMSEFLKMRISGGKDIIEKLEAQRKEIVTLQGRFLTDEPANLMEDILKVRPAEIDASIKGITHGLEIIAKAEAHIKHYTFEMDKQQGYQPPRYRSLTFSQTFGH